MSIDKKYVLKGKTVLVTAGPTREHMDPIRFISNPSTGKMGYALAQVAKAYGAEVILISGPTYLIPPEGIQVINIVSAQELRNAVLNHFDKVDIFISAAAVADYRPDSIGGSKIKKTKEEMVIRLVRNPDILSEVGKMKGERILVGFAAETEDVIANAKIKLKSKNLDLIVANDVRKKDSGFGSDENIVTIISSLGDVLRLPKLPKLRVAEHIIERVIEIIRKRD